MKDMPRQMTRADVVRVLGISETSSRRLEREGVLVGTVDQATGTHQFTEEAVQLAAATLATRAATDRGTRDGSPSPTPPVGGPLEADVFSDLDAGRTLTQIVQSRRLPAAQVKAAYMAWLDLKQVDVHQPIQPQALQTVLQRLARVEKLADALLHGLTGWVDVLKQSPGLGRRKGWKCPSCGDEGLVETPVRCAACGDIHWGK